MRLRSLFCIIPIVVTVSSLPLVEREAIAIGEGILATKHNLSVSGPGPIKAVSEVRVCIFCHTPHHASGINPLWDRPEVTTVYNIYSSSTRFAKPGQPTGSSRLCLSCHDGTIAVGALINNTSIAMAGGYTTIPVGWATNLGGPTGGNLTNDHPISFAYTNDLAAKDLQLKPPALISGKLRLDANHNVQCTTCHNPHVDPYGKFLVMDNTKSALCTSCHQVTGWDTSLHATNGTIAVNGCENCHVPHNAKIPQRLMKETPEEQNCLPCHSSLGGATDVDTTFKYAYTHPVKSYFGVHDPVENPLTDQKHVECEDCHNPHMEQSFTAVPPSINGSLNGLTGVAITGEVKTSPTYAAYEYEVCFKCHADNNFSSTTIVRQIHVLNTRFDFAQNNPSYHPVAYANTSADDQSLRLDLGYTKSSIIYCTDCHGSDQSVKAGGGRTGANGPHGSKFKYILLNEYDTGVYPLPYSDSNYALCYRCHDQTRLFNTTSPFLEVSKNLPLHDLHVRQQGVPCYICHDPHGVSQSNGGTPSANAHLINFVTNVSGVTASYNSSSMPKSCTASCHSSNPRFYGPGS